MMARTRSARDVAAKRRRGVRLALAAIAVLLWTAPRTAAQTLGQIELTFAAFQTEFPKDKAPFKDFWDGLALLRDEDNRQRALKGSVSVGFSGDEAPGNSLFKLKTGAGLGRGVYPAELRFTTEVSLQVKGTEFQEDVTHLVANYDYHLTPHVECYAFLERFTDSFLDIQQRYETGVGAEFGVNVVKPKKWAEKDATLKKFDQALSLVKTAIRELPNDALKGRTRPAAADFDALEQDRKDFPNAFVASESRLYLGMAFSVFSELEQAKIEASVAPAAGTTESTTKEFSLPELHRYRFTVRPTMIARPSSGLTIGVYPYFKLPLDSPRTEVVAGNRKLDYRRDVVTEIDWDLDRSATGNEQVGFVLKFEHHFDNVPPRVGEDVIASEAAAGRVLTGTVAPNRHTAVSLQLNVKWGT